MIPDEQAWKRITDREYAQTIMDCENQYSAEDTHKKADKLLCEVLRLEGYYKVVEAYEKLNRTFG